MLLALHTICKRKNILTLLLMIPSIISMVATRINYDMLTYLPEDMETVIGQSELLEDLIRAHSHSCFLRTWKAKMRQS